MVGPLGHVIFSILPFWGRRIAGLCSSSGDVTVLRVRPCYMVYVCIHEVSHRPMFEHKVIEHPTSSLGHRFLSDQVRIASTTKLSFELCPCTNSPMLL